LDLDLVRVPPGQEQVARAAYERNPNVLYAELNYVRTIPEPLNHSGGEVLPGDYYFDEQWALNNTGQMFYCIPFLDTELCFYIGTNDADIDYPEALAVSSGSSEITIAVLDTGVDYSHPDLAAKYAGGKDFVNDDNDPADDHGHGTHVAGTAAASVNNLTGSPGEEEGVAGVAPNALFIAGKICDAAGMCPDDAIIAGLLWATGCDVDPCGPRRADVINMSIGGPTPSEAINDAVQTAWNQGALPVAAAGNDGSTSPSYPAAYDNVLSVGASDEDDLRAPFSNYGSWVDVAAPGNVIISTWPMIGCAGAPQVPGDFGCYNYLSGTSMATPHVAGVAAMVLSRPDVSTAAQAVDIIQQTADSTGVGTVPLGSWTAHGRVNLHDAMSDGAAGGGPAPTVTVGQAPGQADPTNASPVNFAVTFSEDVSGFDADDVILGGSANPSTAVVSGGPSIYNVAVSGMTGDGSVIASIGAGAANSVDDGAPSEASTSTDNSVTYDTTAPTALIDHAPDQDDPASTSPVNFSVVFSESVSGFDSADVTIGGTAGATTALVTGSGTTYNVAVSGMTGNGTVTASVNAGAAADAAGNASTASNESVVDYATTPVALSVTAIDPDLVNKCNCTYSIEVAGTGFVPGVTVTFSGGSGPAPNASVIEVPLEGTSLTATLTLKSGGPRRASVWDVMVTLPDGTSVVLEDALTVMP
jgi:thermitase